MKFYYFQKIFSKKIYLIFILNNLKYIKPPQFFNFFITNYNFFKKKKNIFLKINKKKGISQITLPATWDRYLHRGLSVDMSSSPPKTRCLLKLTLGQRGRCFLAANQTDQRFFSPENL